MVGCNLNVVYFLWVFTTTVFCKDSCKVYGMDYPEVRKLIPPFNSFLDNP